MIKLESTASGLAVRSFLKIQSPGSEPTIQLRTDEVRSNVTGTWQADPTRRKQFVAYITEDGPAEIYGNVLETEAVEVAAAHTVVLELVMDEVQLPAREAGRVSRAVLAVQVVRVLEVWMTKEKCVYRAKDGISGAPSKEVDMTTGRIAKAS